MNKLETYQLFENKERIGTLQPDTWMILDYQHSKDKSYYKVGLKGVLRPIGCIDEVVLEKAINEGIVELKDIMKIKKHKNKSSLNV